MSHCLVFTAFFKSLNYCKLSPSLSLCRQLLQTQFKIECKRLPPPFKVLFVSSTIPTLFQNKEAKTIINEMYILAIIGCDCSTQQKSLGSQK